MQTLLKPVIADYYANYRLPEESIILQVIGERGARGGIRPGMQLALSDGGHFFSRFVARGDSLPGMYSLIRIKPSQSNKIVRVTSQRTQESQDWIFLGDWVKILDGQHTLGRIGHPIKIFNHHAEGDPDHHLHFPN